KLVQAEEADMSDKYFSQELMAEHYGSLIEKLWDELNASTNKFERLQRFPFGDIQLGTYGESKNFAHGIKVFNQVGSTKLAYPQWTAFLKRLGSQGWRLEQCELRHIAFAITNKLPVSTFYCSAHLAREAPEERRILEGNVTVH